MSRLLLAWNGHSLMTLFRYRFGYESPVEQRSNSLYGTDFESSLEVWIDASDEPAALAWGQEISQAYVAWLFDEDGKRAPDWKRCEFANWVEPAEQCESVHVVAAGTIPDFSVWPR